MQRFDNLSRWSCYSQSFFAVHSDVHGGVTPILGVLLLQIWSSFSCCLDDLLISLYFVFFFSVVLICDWRTLITSHLVNTIIFNCPVKNVKCVLHCSNFKIDWKASLYFFCFFHTKSHGTNRFEAKIVLMQRLIFNAKLGNQVPRNYHPFQLATFLLKIKWPLTLTFCHFFCEKVGRMTSRSTFSVGAWIRKTRVSENVCLKQKQSKREPWGIYQMGDTSNWENCLE